MVDVHVDCYTCIVLRFPHAGNFTCIGNFIEYLKKRIDDTHLFGASCIYTVVEVPVVAYELSSHIP